MLSRRQLLSVFPLVFLSFDMTVEGSVGPMDCPSFTSLSALLIVAWTTLMRGLECATPAEVEQHLEMGKKMLAAGQMADALSHYHAAIEGDPKNYMAYYRRATVYLAMGKSKAALPDLDKVIEIKPDFTAARVQRGNVRLKQGKLDEAHTDYSHVLERDPSNADAQQHLETIPQLKHNIDLAWQLFEDHDYNTAIHILSQVLDAVPWDPNLRELRAECYIAQGDFFKAIGDIRPTTKLRSDNTQAYYRLSTLYYEMGDADESLTEIRECLKLDPDHKDCFPHYKKVKKLVKQMTSVQTFINEKKWTECVSKANQMMETEPKVFTFLHRAKGHICHCHSKAGAFKEALDACNEILSVDENNIDAICDRAEAYISNQMYEEAIQDYQKAEGIAGDLKKVVEGLKRAKKLLKQSKKRDYYKILGVKRNASKHEIMKAYRRLAVKWHPDKYDGNDKAHAEKMFIDIAAAKEVLTDPEKKQKFDNGEDPLDPEEQSQGGGGPFWHQGFNPFGAGGFQFKFHY